MELTMIKLITERFFSILVKLNKVKIPLYIICFNLLFMFYYMGTLPSFMRRTTPFTGELAITAYVFMALYLISLGVAFYLLKKWNLNFDALFLTSVPLLTGALVFFIGIFITTNSPYSLNVSDSIIFRSIFGSFLLAFFLIFLSLFFYSIYDVPFSLEFFLSGLVLAIFTTGYVALTLYGENNINTRLKETDFTTLTINCHDFFTDEGFENSVPETSFYNAETGQMQDYILADFYYPGSYCSYLSDSPLNGTPSLNALEIVLSKFKCRMIHLDVYSDKDDEYDPSAYPVIRPPQLKEGASSLAFNDVMECILTHGLQEGNPYPLFLYLEFHFNQDNTAIHMKIYDSLLYYFSNYFVDKKYSFIGRDSHFSISMATLKECLGKIIFITNDYPTKTVLDELVNASTNILNNNFKVMEYKKSYITFDKIGLSQDKKKMDQKKWTKKNGPKKIEQKIFTKKKWTKKNGPKKMDQKKWTKTF